jgi:SAM-dependent methyltransferase
MRLISDKPIYGKLRKLAGIAVRRTIPWVLDPPPVGAARFRSFRNVRPIRPAFGFSTRRQVVDRFYIERFLERNADDIHGRTLEIGDDSYTRRFGNGGVRQSDVLHCELGRDKVTIVGDLTTGEGLPSNTFDCVILTQTLNCVYDVRGAVRTLHRILAPGGVVLVTVPGIAQLSRYDMDRWGEYWRFTSLSALKLFGEVFPEEQLDVEAHGNVYAAVAFLHGLVASELKESELEFRDPDYEVIITVRAAKPPLTGDSGSSTLRAVPP